MDKRAMDFQVTRSGDASPVDSGRPPARGDEPSGTPTTTDSLVLARVVANDIIPRLLLAHRLGDAGTERPTAPCRPPTEQELAQLVDAAVSMDTGGAVEQVEARLVRGESHEAALLDFVGGAARMLGQQWDDDERTFADVTIGLATLHRVVSVLRYRLAAPGCSRRLVVLVAAAGEQHTLAIHVLGDLLARAGWDADVRPVFDEAELVATVASEVVVMVGISVHAEPRVDALARTVARVRTASLNREVAVMLGGSVDLERHAAAVGAHYFADARQALDWLDCHGRVAF